MDQKSVVACWLVVTYAFAAKAGWTALAGFTLDLVFGTYQQSLRLS